MTGEMVNTDRAREHVRRLIADGMTQTAIAAAGGVTMSALSMLLHGHFAPGRPTQQTMSAVSSRQLLAVEFEPPARRKADCNPEDRFTPAGYRVGRCDDCGQLAPIRNAYGRTDGTEHIVRHPRPKPQDVASPEPAVEK